MTSGYRGVTAAILFFVAFVSHANNLMVAPLLKDIAGTVNADISQVGLLVTIYGLAVGIMSLMAGPLSDRFGRKRVIQAFILLSSVTSILFAMSWDLTSLYVTRLANALATGPLLGAAMAGVVDYVPVEVRGRVSGYLTSAVFLATILGVPVGIGLSMVPGVDWSAAFIFVGILSLCVGLAVTISLPNVPPARKVTGIGRVVQGYWGILCRKDYQVVFAMYFAVFFANGIFMTYYPSYLLTNRSMPMTGLLWVYMIGGVCAFAATFTAGRAAERFNLFPMATLASTCIVAMMLTIIAIPSTPQTISGIVLVVSIIYMSSEAFRQTAMQTRVVTVAGNENRGVFMGVVTFLIAVGVSSGAGVASMVLSLLAGGTVEKGTQLVGFEYITLLAASVVILSTVFMAKILKTKINETDELSVVKGRT